MTLRYLLALISVLASTPGLSTPVWGVERKCLQSEIEAMLGGKGGYGAQVDTTQYANAGKLLFLSDSAEESHQALSLGEVVAGTYPEKVVVRSDFGFQGNTASGNLSTLFMDNTKPFPFPDNSFDIIVMRRGLCLCHGGRVCGGFLPNGEQCKQFFAEVTRVLNKSNPKAKAVLHGSYGVFPATEGEWFRMFEALEQSEDIAVEFLMAPWGGFNSIVISPKRLP